MNIWFVTIGVLGLAGIVQHPAVLAALDPRVGLAYLFGHGFAGFLVLGGVFLCATGAEAEGGLQQPYTGVHRPHGTALAAPEC